MSRTPAQIKADHARRIRQDEETRRGVHTLTTGFMALVWSVSLLVGLAFPPALILTVVIPVLGFRRMKRERQEAGTWPGPVITVTRKESGS